MSLLAHSLSFSELPGGGWGGERPANPTVSPHLQEFGWITQLLSLRDSYHSSGTDHF